MKTTFAYDHYYLQEEIEEHVAYFAEKYPDLFSFEYLCETPDKHHIIAATITNTKTGPADKKPAFHVDGNTHAGEVTGMMNAMHIMDVLVTCYGEDEKVTFLLDNYTVYVIPSVSPDGSQHYLTTSDTLRSVNRSYYQDRGTGLEQKDMDGDDVVRMMRVKSPYGIWKKDPSDPDLMIQRQAGDYAGAFYNIYMEGEIDDFDGITVENKKMKFGRDFNRNYPYGWFPESRQPGAGEYPLCAPETKALADWIINHPNIGSVATNHTSGGMIIYVPGTHPEAEAPKEDMKLMSTIAHIGNEMTGYIDCNIFDTFITDKANFSSGAFDDYCYETQGIYAVTTEFWDLDHRCGIPYRWDYPKKPGLNQPFDFLAKRIAWVKENAPQDWKSWTEFEHPQLGKVEIGGFNYKFTIQNPPCHMLHDEIAKVTDFYIVWALSMPRLVIDSVSCTDLGGDFYQIDAVVSNAGYLPTYLSQKAKKLGTDKPVLVSLNVEAESLINCKAEQDIGDLSSYGLVPASGHFYGNIANGPSKPISKKVSWVVKGKHEGLVVTASNPKAGTVSKAL